MQLGWLQATTGSPYGINSNSLSKIENEWLHSGDYPGEELICKIA
jgi:hypothetical protein